MKPMLACSTIPNLKDLTYPMLASPKLDGLRCLAIDGKAYSRTMKLIANDAVQYYFRRHHLHGLDGELMVQGDFSAVQSAMNSKRGEPDFSYHVFDSFLYPDKGFIARLSHIPEKLPERVTVLHQTLVANPLEAQQHLANCIEQGYEGSVLRSLEGPYKYGRSTLKQGWMLKLKLFADDEAFVVGYNEQMHNMDTSTKKIANLVPRNTLGSLVVSLGGNLTFSLGSGFDDATRQHIWDNQAKYMGCKVTFKHQGYCSGGKPRFPIFKGFRYD